MSNFENSLIFHYEFLTNDILHPLKLCDIKFKCLVKVKIFNKIVKYDIYLIFIILPLVIIVQNFVFQYTKV